MQREEKRWVSLFSLMILSISLSAQTNYSPLYTSANFVKTIDLSRPVGTVAATPGTTPSGGVTYSIPIYAPPGTNGMQPSISVVYSSQGGAGVVGFGWSITGLSVISRTGKNLYHNGSAKAVSYTSEDAFLMDGMRLNPIIGNNGANGTVYAGETESFSTIISNTSSSPNNPDWFLVTTKDGTNMEFGNTIDSRIMTDDGQNVMLWRMNRIIDINGNYIDFKYNNDSRDSRIDEINYTGNTNSGLLPYNKIKFNYGYRYETNTVYDGGASLSSQYLLNNIAISQINDNNVTETVKTYYLKYGFDNVQSLLKEIEECGSISPGVLKPEGDPNRPPPPPPPPLPPAYLNSTIFLYGDPAINVTTLQTVALTGQNELYSGDFNSDGKSDLLVTDYYVDQNLGILFNTNYSLIKDVDESGYGVLYSKTLPPQGTSVNLQDKKFINFLTGDYNGDSRDDVLQLNSSTETIVIGGEGTNQCWYYYYRKIANATINFTKGHNPQTGLTNYDPIDYPIPSGLGGTQYQYVSQKGIFLIAGDFDGNGNQDYIFVLGKKRTIGTCGGFNPVYQFDYKAYITSPSTNEINVEIANFGFGPNPNPEFYAGTVANADKVDVLDFDGDGKMEILITKDQQTYVLAIQRVSIATGFAFAANVVYSTSDITWQSNIFPGDFNGDRKTDLLVRSNNGTWQILYATGTGFSAIPFTFNQSVNISGNGDLIQVSDFNGDGKSDILHGFAYWQGGISNSSRFSVYYSKGISFYNEVYVYNNVLAYSEGGHSKNIITADFNGDGITDLINKPNIGSQVDFISIKPSGKERLLLKITDGHNVTTAFEYKLLTDKTTYPYVYNRTVSLDDPANLNPFNYVELPIYVVSSMSVPDGIGGTNSSSFYYEDAVVHRYAKGFLGFKKITAINANAGITAVTENAINTQFAVPYATKQTTKRTATSELLSESYITNSFINLSTGNHDIRYFQKVDKTLGIDYLNDRASESVNTYDNYGNITTNISKAGIPSGNTVNPTETATTTTVYGIHNTPVPARPENITVSNTRTGMPTISSTSAITYTANGLPATQTAFYSLPKAVTTTYTYNSFGNTIQTITSASGLSNRTTAAVYDAKGRYPVTKQVIGSTVTQTEAFTYDSKWGSPLSQYSMDCLVTWFEYDQFGRVNKTYLPAGYSVNNTLVWDLQGQQVFYSFVDFPGGRPDTKTWVDKLGRGIKSQTAGFNNQWLTQLTTYDSRGNVSTTTNDYYPGETPLVTTTTYDVYNRPVLISNTLNTISSTYTQLGNGRMQITTQNSAGQSATKIGDATGKTVTAIDNGGQLDYTYDSRGNQTEVKHGNTVLITNAYDIYGRQTSLDDKNSGTVTYDYDAYGQLSHQTDNLGNAYTMSYDDLGRITTRQGPEGNTSYEYFKNQGYPIVPCNNNNLSKVTGFNGVVKEYTYDYLNRLESEKLTINAFIGGQSFTTQYSYDIYGNNTNTIYPSGVVVNIFYDANGGLSSVTGGDSWNPVTLFTANAVNSFGQYTNYTLGNGKTSQNTYNYGIPTRFYTPGVQDLNFTFDFVKGNLLSRYEATKNLTETFQYDNLNRLTTTTVNGVQQLSINYDGNSSFSMGNITSKTDAGNYVYYNGSNGINKIHAVAYITNPAGPTAPPITISPTLQQLTYTPFLKTATVSEGSVQTNFTYGPDYQRVKSEFYVSGGLNSTKYYFGDFERVINGGYTRDIHYIPLGNSLAIIETPLYSSSIIHFVYTDHLGSLLTRTDINGNITAEQNFDAWGRLRNPNDWQYQSYISGNFFDRGYTGHEQMPYHDLINMNGRMYDPIQGRMLSPDNYVPDPWSTQGYNRYTYANNNPLVYTDPDGNFLKFAFFGIAFLGEFVSNLIYGESNAFGKAVKSASTATSEFGNVLQFPIYQNGNTTITAGIDIFSLGVSANWYHQEGDWTFHAGAGAGFIGGGNLGVGVNYRVDLGSGGYVNLGISGGINGNGSYRVGGGIEAGGRDFAAGLYSTYYGGEGKTKSQWVGGASMRIGDLGIRYENDGVPFSNTLGDGGDRYRTTAVQISYRDIALRMNLYTGDAATADHKLDESTISKRYPNGYYKGGNVDDYRLGGLSFGYKGDFIGVNSEWVRHIGQDVIAHRWIAPQRGFKMLSTNWQLYLPGVQSYQPYNLFPFSSRYSLW